MLVYCVILMDGPVFPINGLIPEEALLSPPWGAYEFVGLESAITRTG